MLGNILGKEPVEPENESRIITQRATGEVLTLEGTAEANYKDFKVYGKSWQETRDDKNLLEPIEFDKTIENNFTLSARDGIYSINGTVPIYAAQQFGWRLTTSYRGTNYTTYINNTDVTFILSPDTYTVSVKFLGGTINNTEDRVHLSYRLDNTSGGGSVNGYTIGEITKTTKINEVISRTFTLEEDTHFTVFASVLRLYENSTYNNVRWVIQLEKGEVATDYQPYGVSPSPEFPSPIKSVADDINLFDEQWEGTVSKNFIPVIAGEEYIYSEQNAGTTVFYDFYETKESEKQSENWKGVNSVFIPESNGFIKLRKSTTSKIQCKLQKGSVVTPYSEYGKGTVKIQQCAKNHFDISKITNIDYLTNNGDGTLTLKDNINTAGWTSTGKSLHTLCPNLKEGQKIVVSFNSTSKMSNKDNFHLSRADYFGTKGHPFTVTEKMLNSTFCLYGGYNEETLISNIQVEIGEIPTEYEHYVGEDTVIQTAPLYGLKTNDASLANYTDESGQKWIADYLGPDGIHRRTYKVRVTQDNWFNSGFNGGAGSSYADWQNATFGIVSTKFGTEFPKFIKGHALCTIAPYGVGGERR